MDDVQRAQRLRLAEYSFRCRGADQRCVLLERVQTKRGGLDGDGCIGRGALNCVCSMHRRIWSCPSDHRFRFNARGRDTKLASSSRTARATRGTTRGGYRVCMNESPARAGPAGSAGRHRMSGLGAGGDVVHSDSRECCASVAAPTIGWSVRWSDGERS